MTKGDKWVLNPYGYDHDNPSNLLKQAQAYVNKNSDTKEYKEWYTKYYDKTGYIKHKTPGWKGIK